MFVIYNMEASGNFAPAFGIGYEVCDLKVFIFEDVEMFHFVGYWKYHDL